MNELVHQESVPIESVPTESVPWLSNLRDWPAAALEALQREPVIARVVVAQVRGSAPREAGVTMLVEPKRILGTIGGGQLEWQALAAARALLAESDTCARVQRLVLGADLGQCCGGVVELWIERLTRRDLGWLEAAQKAAAAGPALLQSTLGSEGLQRRLLRTTGGDLECAGMLNASLLPSPRLRRVDSGPIALLERLDDSRPLLWLFGAGYVGQALARILMELPLRLTWVDARRELFPSLLPADVQALIEDPLASLARAPVGARFLVMTHSHALDYALVRALLERNDFAWLGLIGSQSKAARFRSRLRREGVKADRMARLVCPIGIDGVTSKWPAAIAVGIAAQVLQQLAQSTDVAPSRAATEPHSVAACEGDCGHCQAGHSAAQ